MIKLTPLTPEIKSKQIYILFHGYTSEYQSIYAWKGLFKEAPESSIFYLLNWNAGGRYSFLWYLTCYSDFPNKTDNSKYVGKLLGALLAKRFLFPDYEINLCGHSLGCNVIKYALKKLKDFKAFGRINNCYLMGGATEFVNIDKWKDIFRYVVKGKIICNYSDCDFILKKIYPWVYPNKKPIGLYGLKEDIVSQNGFKIQNIDLTQMNIGHTYYFDNLEDISKQWNLKDN